MKKLLLLAVVILSLTCSACGAKGRTGAAADEKVNNEEIENESVVLENEYAMEEFEAYEPQGADKLFDLLLKPMSEVCDAMEWTEEDLETVQTTHYKVPAWKDSFFGCDTSLYLSPSIMPTQEQREDPDLSEMFDLSDLPVPAYADEQYLQRYAYVTVFEGDNAMTNACQYMEAVVNNYTAIYGDALQSGDRSYSRNDAPAFFEAVMDDTENFDRHSLYEKWELTSGGIKGVEYLLIVSVSEVRESETEISGYRVAVSYEWQLIRN
ncbi:MAG: hypothetical protein HUJ69_00355 [Lachnospiraceae bacterium]|nr:hypothetical protein [Lachnospiraceae bacterium]